MNKFKMFLAKHIFKEIPAAILEDASGKSGGQRELASEFIKSISYKENNDTEFEDPENSLEDIQSAYNIDSYVRQGVDKYVDQIFKEGYSFYGTDENAVQYLKLRLDYIAEATKTPTNQFLIDIAEDIVKYGNCMILKVRSNDPNALPQGVNISGLGGADPIAGYFCANPVTMKCKRDDYGTVEKWQQDNDKGKQEFDPDQVIHFYYKREKGKAYGTPFLIPVLADVKALRRAEENVLQMMYRNIYPYFHYIVGTEDAPGTKEEVDEVQETIDSADLEFGLVTTERVTIKPIASDKVIEASPYLSYLEERIFSGMGIPAIMFGRGNTANRNTGDNMTSEMADRIRAMSKTIEMFFNNFIIKELLMEGGYDPILNPDQAVEFRFNDNDVDVEIKKQVHAVYKYEHNSITEDEMRKELGMDPIQDSEREKLFVELITRQNLKLESQLSQQTSENSKSGETNNKEQNQGGSNNKKKDYLKPITIGLLKDEINDSNKKILEYITTCRDKNIQVLNSVINVEISDCVNNIKYIIARDTELTDEILTKLDLVKIELEKDNYNGLIGIDINNNIEFGILKDNIEYNNKKFQDSILNLLT